MSKGTVFGAALRRTLGRGPAGDKEEGLLCRGARETWLLLPRRAPGTSKATNLTRKCHGVHTEEESNPDSVTYLCDIGQSLESRPRIFVPPPG